MRIHNLSPQEGSTKRRRRVGRGISAGQGASGGFGMRGQKSRSGTGTKAGFEGGQMPLYRRVPKLKHFPLVNPSKFTIINVSKLNNLAANSNVDLDSLMQQRIVTSNDGPLKILGDGELNVALMVKAAAFTKSAQRKIESAGGSCQNTSNITTDK
ncbi:50S ribosomal protein L15 [Candidatus Atelocyanobacterium thalassae]|uniref:Large ribosomal subunit protein uL15 n=1 Tax=Atelocyanobacterium thalassa (isolate ALOHA) TaxID=1453429 RepID=D3EQG9_ATETH|nr:50S ribosomal protein L15 [Candidatus Atelocyanobacterium thalassa]ADB95719.1 LSU ribosomal protein L15P [Candidatus Atelocyanobacterium thalassa isolate ALOHA]MCH2543062.1 50S ribosomal protein L15 [Candidatus Atelocyanobacterium sp. ALOHA_A2.5_9]|tara:strand:+ start:693 stop:1157 length:465 start_codon:yes stop_codon:yes gene_type:complete